MSGALDKRAKCEQDPESCWETPEWLVARVRRAFSGSIDLDPCTTSENPTKAFRFYTPEDDGILQPWIAKCIYVNPPYGATIRHWTRKAVSASLDGCSVILLVPARTDTQWWHELANKATAILFFNGRIRFKGAGGSPKFPSALVGLNHDLREFADLGLLVEHAA